MTAIHPFVYMLVGVVISGYSKFVEYKNPDSYLGPFFWLGLIFLIIGIVKLVFRRMNQESKKKEDDFEQKYKQVEQGFKQNNQQFYDNNQKDSYTGLKKY